MKNARPGRSTRHTRYLALGSALFLVACGPPLEGEEPDGGSSSGGGSSSSGGFSSSSGGPSSSSSGGSSSSSGGSSSSSGGSSSSSGGSSSSSGGSSSSSGGSSSSSGGAPDGARLYATKCARCHGELSVSEYRGATAAQIRGKHSSLATAAEAQAIADALR